MADINQIKKLVEETEFSSQETKDKIEEILARAELGQKLDEEDRNGLLTLLKAEMLLDARTIRDNKAELAEIDKLIAELSGQSAL